MFAIITSGNLSFAPTFQVEEEKIVDTPYGPTSSPIWIGYFGSQKTAFLARHGAERNILPHQVNYRANVWAVHHLGMAGIVSMSAVAAVSDRVRPNSLVLPKDLIDYTYGRENSFTDIGKVEYVNMENPFDEGLRQLLFAMAFGRGIEIDMDLTYGCIQGPRMPTKAEAARYRRDGCDVIGMVGMPEIALAHELNMPIAFLGNVVGVAASDNPSERPDLHDYKDHASFQYIHQMIDGV